MRNFIVKFTRDFEVLVDAESLDMAEKIGKEITGQFPVDTCKLLSVIDVNAVELEKPAPPTKPFGRPKGGGSPGTPTIRVPELVDQIAAAA